jgi:ABC-type transport system substrate-binding protein
MRRLAAALLALPLLVPALPGCGGQDTPSGTEPLRVTLSYGSNSRPYMPLPEEVAKQVAGDLQEAGFEVALNKVEWAPYLKLVQDGGHQLALLGWSADVPDIDNFLYVLLDKTNARKGSANNISFYTSEEVHVLLDKARYAYDAKERMDLYREAQELIFRDVPMVPLAYSERVIAHGKAYRPVALELVTHPLLRLIREPADGRLVFARGSDSVKLDPALVTDGESSNVIEQVFDTLVRFKPGSAEIEPSLAASWRRSDDGTVWTFTLRPGVVFHDGSPVDAKAVVNAFERQRDPKHPHHFPGEYAFWLDLLDYVSKVEEGPGPDEVTFRCSRPAPAFFLQTLGVFTFSIPSQKALEALGPDFARHPIGSGPFLVRSWRSDVEIALARNDRYWDGAPALKEVFYRVAADPVARSQQLRAGEAGLIDNVDLNTIATLEKDSRVVVVRQPGLHFAYLAMNTQRPPFDDRRVREAVALALDKGRILKAAWRGYAQPAVNPVPPGIPGFHAGLKDRARDLTRARALLAEARTGSR